jgi:hypothetical protein
MREKNFIRFASTDFSEHLIVKYHKIFQAGYIGVYELCCLGLCVAMNIPLEQFQHAQQVKSTIILNTESPCILIIISVENTD